MPRQKKVPEVPVETINAVGAALNGAAESLNQMSYAQVLSLSDEAVKYVDSAVVELGRAISYFNKTYINRPKQPVPARKATKVHKALKAVAGLTEPLTE